MQKVRVTEVTMWEDPAPLEGAPPLLDSYWHIAMELLGQFDMTMDYNFYQGREPEGGLTTADLLVVIDQRNEATVWLFDADDPSSLLVAFDNWVRHTTKNAYRFVLGREEDPYAISLRMHIT